MKEENELKEILEKVSSPKGFRINNPYAKDYMEILCANSYLKENKQKIPKLFKELEKQIWNKTKNWGIK